MTKLPKVGDRVCVTPKNRLTCFLPGDRGEVLAGPEVVAGSKLRYYLVAVEGFRKGGWAVFAEDEIKPEPRRKDGLVSRELKVGDWVRVTWRNRLWRCRPGETGTIVRLPQGAGEEGQFYLVAMDQDPPGSVTAFRPGEIEADD